LYIYMKYNDDRMELNNKTVKCKPLTAGYHLKSKLDKSTV